MATAALGQLNIQSPADIPAAQDTLAHELWGDAGKPSGIARITPASNALGITGYAACFTLDLPGYPAENYISPPCVWLSSSPNGRWAILHSGHGATWTDEQFPEALQALLYMGYSVIGLTMPAGDHDALRLPLSAYVGPVVEVVNTLRSLHYSDITMMGISGGGWTTTIAAAADTRIMRSYPIAGTMPLICPTPRDWEQRLPGLSASYEDLYVLATTNGRHQKQILYIFDGCCFSFADYAAGYDYGPMIAAVTGGRYELAWALLEVHQFEPSVIRRELPLVRSLSPGKAQGLLSAWFNAVSIQ